MRKCLEYEGKFFERIKKKISNKKKYFYEKTKSI